MKPVYFLIFIAAITIFFMIQLFDPFLKALFVALLLTVATSSLAQFLEARLKSKMLATTIMTITLAGIFIIPVMYCIFAFANFFNSVDQEALLRNFASIKFWVENLSDDF